MRTERPTYFLQPIGDKSTQILRQAAAEKPLSAEEISFLDEYQKQLSSREFDPILKYYLQKYSGENKYHASFLLPEEILNPEAIKKFKKRLQFFIMNQKKKSVRINLTHKQFLQFRELSMQELIFWHGNQLLTGAPMFPGGTPPVIFFQWGNLFGVVKYLVLPAEKTLKSNLMIYFEDMQDRDLDLCVHNYNERFQEEKVHQNHILLEHRIEPVKFNEYLIKPSLIRQRG